MEFYETAFLNDLAVRQRTSASTQNQALCALVFLYRKVLEVDMPALDGLQRARRPEHLPTVLSRPAVRALLDQLQPPFRLLGELLYGAGLRVNEALALRIKDVDLDRHQITVRRGKGAHDRTARRQPPCRDVHPVVAHHPKQTLRPSPLRGQPLLQPFFRPRRCVRAWGWSRDCWHRRLRRAAQTTSPAQSVTCARASPAPHLPPATSHSPRRARAVTHRPQTKRQPRSPQGRSSPDRGAENIAGGR
jgi:integrase